MLRGLFQCTSLLRYRTAWTSECDTTVIVKGAISIIDDPHPQMLSQCCSYRALTGSRANYTRHEPPEWDRDHEATEACSKTFATCFAIIVAFSPIQLCCIQTELYPWAAKGAQAGAQIREAATESSCKVLIYKCVQELCLLGFFFF